MVKTVTDVKAGSGDTSSLAAAVIAKATAPSTATKAGKVGKDGLLDTVEAETLALSAEELLDQCKCPISLELMRRPVLPSSGMCLKFKFCLVQIPIMTCTGDQAMQCKHRPSF